MFLINVWKQQMSLSNVIFSDLASCSLLLFFGHVCRNTTIRERTASHNFSYSDKSEFVAIDNDFPTKVHLIIDVKWAELKWFLSEFAVGVCSGTVYMTIEQNLSLQKDIFIDKWRAAYSSLEEVFSRKVSVCFRVFLQLSGKDFLARRFINKQFNRRKELRE